MKKKEEERVIRAIQLRDPNVEINESWNQYNHDDPETDAGILASNNELYGDTLFHQVYEHIKSTQNVGVSGSELAIHFAQSKLFVRTLIRNLERLKCISSYSCNEGRQKLQRYVVKEFAVLENDDHSDVDDRDCKTDALLQPV